MRVRNESKQTEPMAAVPLHGSDTAFRPSVHHPGEEKSHRGHVSLGRGTQTSQLLLVKTLPVFEVVVQVLH